MWIVLLSILCCICNSLYRYNRRAKEWVEGGIAEFENLEFTVNDSNSMIPDTSVDGKFYPVRDSCDKEGDPAEKCLTTAALHYKSTIEKSGDSVYVKINLGETNIVEEAYPYIKEEVYTSSDLNCHLDEEYAILSN